MSHPHPHLLPELHLPSLVGVRISIHRTFTPNRPFMLLSQRSHHRRGWSPTSVGGAHLTAHTLPRWLPFSSASVSYPNFSFLRKSRPLGYGYPSSPDALHTPGFPPSSARDYIFSFLAHSFTKNYYDQINRVKFTCAPGGLRL